MKLLLVNNNNTNNILGTSQKIRKYYSLKLEPLSGGDPCWFKGSTRKKRPVTRDNGNIIIIIITNSMKQSTS